MTRKEKIQKSIEILTDVRNGGAKNTDAGGYIYDADYYVALGIAIEVMNENLENARKAYDEQKKG